MLSPFRENFLTSPVKQSRQDIRIMSGIDRIARQRRTQRGFEPIGSCGIQKNLFNFRQIVCFQRMVHSSTSGNPDIDTLSRNSLGGRTCITCGVQFNGPRL